MDHRSWEARPRGAASVFEILRADIIALHLRPGAVLSRADLQERFGVSSTPVRDALMRLQEEGLVEVFPQHATLVARIDVARARRAQFLRRSVEVEIVRTLAGRTAAAVAARLRGLIRQQAALARAGEHQAFTEADHAFHRTLYDAADVPDLWALVRRHGGHIDRLRRLHLPVAGKMREIVAHHGAIVDAVERGSAAAAEEAMRAHLSRSLDFVDALVDRHPDYFPPAGAAPPRAASDAA